MVPNSTWQQVSVQLYMCVSKKLNFCLLQIGQRHGKSFCHLATAQKDRRKDQKSKGTDGKKVRMKKVFLPYHTQIGGVP